MNWGIKILIFYIGFIAIVVASTFFAMNQKNDLVTDNYYEKELKYQEHIEKEQRTKSLNEKTEIQLLDKKIHIKFPNIPDKKNDKNIILLYRPSDPLKDLKITISTDSAKTQIISTEKLTSGYWKIKINWFSNNLEYYHENTINIP